MELSGFLLFYHRPITLQNAGLPRSGFCDKVTVKRKAGWQCNRLQCTIFAGYPARMGFASGGRDLGEGHVALIRDLHGQCTGFIPGIVSFIDAHIGGSKVFLLLSVPVIINNLLTGS